MAHFDTALRSGAAEIEAALDTLLTPVALGGPGEPPERLLAAMRHGTLNGGKRLRPFLLRETARMFGTAREHAIAAAVSVELVHCYSLIHDDLPAMDDDDLRRGQPTVHKAFDDATAILAGDALLTLAFGHLSQHGHAEPAIALQLVTELATAAGAGGLVGGQMRDIEGETQTLDEIAISRMQAMKTGALIRASVRMGAILAGADNEALGALTEYAEALGRAFQLADDLLDVTASSDTMGKATGKDRGSNKQTLVARVGIDAARRHLGDMVHDAITALTRFGPEADTLREAARYVATREN
jgi:farnesyl diphosphate synthase